MGDRQGERSTAALFPGQGSQTADMGRYVDWLRSDLRRRARQAVGSDPFERIAEGGRFLQPAIFCASLASWSWMRDEDVECCAGHSLGEIAALTAAGAIDEDDALRLVALRGRLCDEAASHSTPGGMLALLGRGADDAGREIAAETALVLANDNGARQVVLSGPRADIADGERMATERGVHAVVLDVPAAMHSPAMEAAVAPFAQALAEVEVRPARKAVWSSTRAAPFTDVRAELADALVRPVRWRETVLSMTDDGVDGYVEMAPGTVLSGLVRRIAPALHSREPQLAFHV